MLSIGWGEVNPIGSTRNRIKRNIEEQYDDVAALNITNGVHSLELFSTLIPGDIVFMRGASAIIDVAIIVGNPFYQFGAGHSGPNDYCTKVSFTPLFGSQRFMLAVDEIPERYRREFVFNDGRSRTMKQITETLAIILLQRISVVI
jgi:hypothetical protein